MTTPRWFRKLLQISIYSAATLLGVCSNARADQHVTSKVPTVRTPVKGPLLFAGEYSHHKTAVVDAADRVIETLPVPPGWLAFDTQGTLYDVPFSQTDVTLVYKPPYHEPILKLGFGEYTTSGVAVDPRTNVMAVTLINYNNGFSGSKIDFFRRGEAEPCASVQQSGGYFVGGAAFDREGRLFALLYNGTDYVIGSIGGQCRAKTIELYTLPARLVPSSYFTFDANDDLVFQVSSRVAQIETFAHPVQGHFASPISTTLLQLPGTQGFTYASFSCLSSDGRFLWAAAGPEQLRPTVFDEFRYPQGGLPVAVVPVEAAYNCATVFP